MPSSSELFRRVAPVVLFISLLVLYLFSMAPGFTWAHDGADGGDLITAAATGGVAHPSGYPTFLLLARLFQFLPLGTIAYRTNLMSAVFTALSALLVYDIVVLGDGVLSSPWYIDVLHDTYPALTLSLQDVISQSIAEANPARPTCTAVIVDELMAIDCYKPAADKPNPNVPFVSVNQPIEQ